MEFLMTYGWAILVVLAAIGALAYFGVLSPDNFLPSKCTISPQFACKEWKVSEDGSVQLQIQNNVGTSIDVNVSMTNFPAECAGEEMNVSYTGIRNGADLGDVNGLFQLNCTSALDSDLDDGDKFAADILIQYKDSSQTLWHTATGTLQTKVEP